MKRFLFLAVLIALVATVANSQLNYYSTPCGKSTYVASTNDTTKAVKILSATLISFYVHVGDSASIRYVFQTSLDNSTWTYREADTLTKTTGSLNLGGYDEYSLRSATADSLAGQLTGWIRAVRIPAAAGATIGVSTPTIEQKWIYRP
jgi:hypothetical protein